MTVTERMQRLLSEKIKDAETLLSGVDAAALEDALRSVVKTVSGKWYEGTAYGYATNPWESPEYNVSWRLKGDFTGVDAYRHGGDLYLYVYPGEVDVEMNGKKIRGRARAGDDYPEKAEEGAWEDFSKDVMKHLTPVLRKYFGVDGHLAGTWDEWEVEVL